MAKATTKVISILLLALIAISFLATQVLAGNSYGPGTVKPSQCYPKCNYRCSDTQYRKPCMFFCQKCCRKCECVPPGTYGNKQVCACYNNWKTKEGGPKCP